MSFFVDINLFGRSSLLNKYKDKKSSTRRRQRMNRTGPSDHQLKYSSLLYLQKLAFFSTVNILWSVSSSTLTGRLHEAVKLIHDLHLGLFYWDHKYMTLPQRVLGIRMAAIPTASRKAGLSKVCIHSMKMLHILILWYIDEYTCAGVAGFGKIFIFRNSSCSHIFAAIAPSPFTAS
jgi:hypothetical protein